LGVAAIDVVEKRAIDRGIKTSVEGFVQNHFNLSGFASVAVEVVDTTGERVTDAARVYSLQPLRTGAELDDGVGEILLNTAFSYEYFVVIGESGSDGPVDYAWYVEGELQEPINALRDDTAQIVVDPEEVSGGGGLRVGVGVNLG
jgi:hypothetical protein